MLTLVCRRMHSGEAEGYTTPGTPSFAPRQASLKSAHQNLTLKSESPVRLPKRLLGGLFVIPISQRKGAVPHRMD